ncbi:hypothetical protein SLEP1_g32237 [Rubroshorea leprosula]|uniref:Uncharacterized protein n=1 Tax=Rubroshorea leprosula TaxID=152421 RepID=A0AAV5KCQ9_9ROSI|nr:hypothetical protein SLEP1_g32237 [Rubroshorea leprosula]
MLALKMPRLLLLNRHLTVDEHHGNCSTTSVHHLPMQIIHNMPQGIGEKHSWRYNKLF